MATFFPSTYPTSAIPWRKNSAGRADPGRISPTRGTFVLLSVALPMEEPSWLHAGERMNKRQNATAAGAASLLLVM
jgi:hypothetical protein